MNDAASFLFPALDVFLEFVAFPEFVVFPELPSSLPARRVPGTRRPWMRAVDEGLNVQKDITGLKDSRRLQFVLP